MNIYPRDILALQKTGLTKQAFVMMPFDPKLDCVYVKVQEACKELSIACIRADSLDGQQPILTNIVEKIGCSQVLIGDLTDKNSNVFYEIGISHAVRRIECIILISQNLEHVPFDLRHLPILLYDADSLLKLKLELKQRIETSLATTDGLKTIFNLVFGLERNIQQSDLFIEYLSKKNPHKIKQIVSIIDDDVLCKEDFAEVYFFFRDEMATAADINKNYLQFLMVSLLSTKYAAREQKEFVREQLKPILDATNFDVSSKGNSVLAQFCFNAVSVNFLKSECINWLINYLNVPKVGNVDVVRSQIEIWLSENNDHEIESVLINRLSSKTPHIRESSADILGIRCSKNAAQHISDALALEGDPYAGRSMINALSRISKDLNHMQIVIDWLFRNTKLWNSSEPKSPSLPDTVVSAIKLMGASDGDIQALSKKVLKLRK